MAHAYSPNYANLLFPSVGGITVAILADVMSIATERKKEPAQGLTSDGPQWRWEMWAAGGRADARPIKAITQRRPRCACK